MPLDFNQLRELLSAIAQTDIAELTLKSNDFELTVRKAIPTLPVVNTNLGEAGSLSPTQLGQIPTAGGALPIVPSPVAGAASAGKNTTPSAAPPGAEQTWEEILSPMVGTFYRAPAPDEAPYIEVGERISSGQVVCIIEAMKLMNEIEADLSGQVIEILVKNGDPVEYKQPLMRIKPN
ncbi:MAG: acetyl-CoA carboxylase biotin carboxyl carrier protein [Symploca sp. SIO2E9]|nr:acetyl-CoA carboxylase biotin carboxyl carrier protein [Symploca sp. SIO2E9]